MAWGWEYAWQCFLPIFNPAGYTEILARQRFKPFDMARLFRDSAQAAHRLKLRQAHGGLAGAHRTFFKGQGLDFSELREYNPGDDIRKLDWQVFARTQVPHIRDYKEERQVRIWIATEWSLSLALGPVNFVMNEGAEAMDTDEPSTLLSDKALRAFEIALQLSQLAQSVQARVGYYWASPQGHGVLRPATGMAQHQRLLSALTQSYPDTRQLLDAPQPPEPSFEALRRLVLKQDWVLVIADASRVSKPWLSSLADMARHARVSVFAVYDQSEWALPGELASFPLQSPDTPHPNPPPQEGRRLSSSHREIQIGRVGEIQTDVMRSSLLEELSALSRACLNDPGRIVPCCVQDVAEQVLYGWLGEDERYGASVSLALKRKGKL